MTANEHEVAGALVREFAMKTPLLIVLIAVIIGAGGGLAAMNNACKKSQCGGSDYLNRISASIGGGSAGVKLPSGRAAG